MNSDIILDSGAFAVIDIFEKEGITAYAVGGCVRNSIMGIAVSDYDITVPTPPDKTKSILEKNGVRTIDTGLKHGTVTAILNKKPYEITTFRTDGEYSDNRRPDSVEFVTDITADLSRRDFTVNAMAYNEKTGIIDLFDGKGDIDRKLIRTVGDPDKRFGEDALRILRALRFASVLGFDIHEGTARSITENSCLLSNVAGERITAELEKAASGRAFEKVLLKFESVFRRILPCFDKMCEKHALRDFCKIYAKTPRTLEFFIALCEVMKNDKKCEKHAPQNIDFGRLVLSNEQKDRVLSMVRNFSVPLSCDRVSVKKLLSYQDKEDVVNLVILKKALGYDADGCLSLIEDIINSGEAYKISHLAVDGNDFKSLGYSGKQIGILLQKALDLVIENKTENQKQSILKKIAED